MFDRTIKTMIFSAVCIALVACSDKPPDCADTRVLERLREAIPRDVVKQITDNIDAAGNWNRPGAQQLRTLLDEFGRGIKVQFKDITSDGFDPAAKKSSCSFEVKINTLDGFTQSRRMSFTIQSTVDSKDFLLNVPDYGAVLGAAGGAFDIYYERAMVAQPAAANVKAPANVCIDARMAAWRKDFDGRQSALIAEAERENREFRPLSPVQEEDSQAAALEQARKECP